MIDFFSKLKDNRIFQFSVVVIIILNAILIGATTYQLDPIFLNTIHLLDYAITVFFVIEILIRFIGEKEKKNFLKDGWNIFDTIIVSNTFQPSLKKFFLFFSPIKRIKISITKKMVIA